MSKMFAAIRVEARHEISEISAAGAHNTRRHIPNNADPSRSDRNQILIGPGRDGEDVGEIAARMTDGHMRLKKQRRAAEILLIASPEYFRHDLPHQAGYYNQKKMEMWRDLNLEWIKKKWGDNIISATLHLDESTPHIHLIVIPKKENGAISYKEFFGGSKYNMSKLQTEYAEAMKPLGLRRGGENIEIDYADNKEFYKAVKRNKQDEIDIDNISMPSLEAPRYFGPLRGWTQGAVEGKVAEVQDEIKQLAKKKLLQNAAEMERLRQENRRITSYVVENDNLKLELQAKEEEKKEAEKKYHEAQLEAKAEIEKLSRILETAKNNLPAFLDYIQQLKNKDREMKMVQRPVLTLET